MSFEEQAKAKAEELGLPVEKKIDTRNEFLVSFGKSLPNSSFASEGRDKFVRLQKTPVGGFTFRDKHTAFRLAAWLIGSVEVLPDEEGQEGITFEQVLEAIRNS